MRESERRNWKGRGDLGSEQLKQDGPDRVGFGSRLLELLRSCLPPPPLTCSPETETAAFYTKEILLYGRFGFGGAEGQVSDYRFLQGPISHILGTIDSCARV